jgi:RNA polymerase sigma-70 factor (ECF subfamily)
MSLNLEQLFRQYYAPLCSYAVSIVGAEDVAEDIVQLLFIQLWETGKYREIKEPERFLLKAVKFRCIDYLRRNRVRNELLSENLFDTRVEPLEIREEDIEPLFQYLAAKLPEKTKQVFLLSRQSGLTYKEIAEELSISVKTVENQMGRALRILRDLLRTENETGRKLLMMFLF